MNAPHLPVPLTIEPDDLDKNPSTAPHLRDLVAGRLNRRDVLTGGVSAMAMAGFGAAGLVASEDAEASVRAVPPGATPARKLDFEALGRFRDDAVHVPAGYQATVVYATGDALDPSIPEYSGDGSESRYDLRAGDHHDGMNWFGLHTRADLRDDRSSTRGLLCVNHENISGTAQFLHTTGGSNLGGTAPARPEEEVIKEIDAHGVSVVEMRRQAGALKTHKPSRFNRRITARTPVELSGPVRGTAYVRTKFSPTGLQARGTLNNCGHGVTPWGTYLTCEENWASYFFRNAGDDSLRPERENAQLRRNGISAGAGGFSYRRWDRVLANQYASSEFERWNCSVVGQSATDDFRNEPNTFGYVVEIDPYAPLSTPKKRTALGRRATEGAWCSVPKPGRPLAFYIGCDSRNEYVYKYVTTERWNPTDAQRGGLNTGDKYLDRGTIYAAVFNADGTGRWEALSMNNPKIVAGLAPSTRFPEGYRFEDLADICVNTRLAGSAVGATRMDRPEWTAVNPFNGEVYITMTENPDRGNVGFSSNSVPNSGLDAANPRYWFDTKAATSQGAASAAQRGNVNGHIVRIREDRDDPGAMSFRWDIFLFGAQAQADAGLDDVNYQANVNLSGLTAANEISKPDGCWFSPTTGILYIQSDDNTMTDRCNAMLLAALPGRLGDGGPVDVVNKAAGAPDPAVRASGVDVVQRTYAGRKMSEVTLKRLFVGPLGAEITGLTETPDGRALFINVQHPGENTGRSGAVPPSVAITPTTPAGPFESNWPGNGGYGPGGASARPRSATVIITRTDGGIIGYDPALPMS
ncbi:hypothetical protein IP87_00235 [beta proteobacterium AAP121]|nr:hypothetical protein IP80_13320 [beta proteobacterium AAP65]KPG01099.1 hypothetical protein IP87_00235 [beta proteobacterium AAP121]